MNEVAATKPTKWNYGKWKNYKITIEEKATVAIITTAILGLIPYVGKLAAPVAALVITWKLKTGYFSAKKDFRFAGSYMLEKQHLKIWKKSNYTQLREYKTADEKIWIAWGGEES
ncbi:hypothetical protein QWY15_12175 [Planococcus sp. N064]|uniref:Conjugal transfer protein n=1 Tax=Planococcus liqunii TaxID=3058394 RepID=A0ABT8MTJ6_9BACL|nr:hypothetical protein [Planococcus sp. N064]MDN7228055.1 hypothetical protein [Planococcus sp. N064]